MPRGRKAKPTNLMKLTGAFREDRHGGRFDAQTEIPTDLPPCPDWIRPEAREHWEEVGAMLAGLNVMAKPHTLALAMLCEALAEWVKTHHGSAWDRVMKACREFGMTPAAITGVKSVKSNEKPTGLSAFKLGA